MNAYAQILIPVNPLTGIETNRFTFYRFLFVVDGLVGLVGWLVGWLGVWACWLHGCLLGLRVEVGREQDRQTIRQEARRAERGREREKERQVAADFPSSCLIVHLSISR